MKKDIKEESKLLSEFKYIIGGKMDDIKKLFNFYKLKDVKRSFLRVGNRPENSAEHTYSCLILAEYFLSKVNSDLIKLNKPKLDELKVMKMLLYHDIVEIEVGDVYFYDETARLNKSEREAKGFIRLKEDLPKEIGREAHDLWLEFEENKTEEAKFCKAIDYMDPMIHALNDKEMWHNAKLTETILRTKKEYVFKEFPIMHKYFEKMIEFYKTNKYFVE